MYSYSSVTYVGSNLLTVILEAHQETNLQTCSPSEDSYQTAHARSLIWIFTGRILNNQICKVSSYGQRRVIGLCNTHAQVDLSLRCAHSSEGTLSHLRPPFTTSIICLPPQQGLILVGRKNYLHSFCFRLTLNVRASELVTILTLKLKKIV